MGKAFIIDQDRAAWSGCKGASFLVVNAYKDQETGLEVMWQFQIKIPMKLPIKNLVG